MKKHKKLIIIIIVIAIIAGLSIWLTSCVKNASNLLQNMSNSAKTVQVEERDIVNSVSASGTITSLSSHSLTTTVAGVKVEKLNVAIGDKVSKDDIICILDDSDLEEKLDDAKYSQSNTSKLSGIENSSASRSLNDAVESQQIEVGRANEKVEKAQNNLNKYEGKANDAYNKYADAHNKSVEAKNEITKAEGELEELRNSYTQLKERSAELKNQFNDAKEGLVEYLNELIAQGVEANVSIVNSTKLGNATNLAVSSIYSGSDEDIKNKVKDYVHEMKTSEEKYGIKEGQVAEAKKTIEEKKVSISGLNTQYDALLKTEETLKTAYEAQAEAVDPYKEALESATQLRDDTVRTTNQSIAARKDSVATTGINTESSKRSAESTVESIEDQITDCEVKSPVDGIITAINVVEGESYAGGAIVTIEDTSSYEVTAYIDEYDISKVKVGQEVKIKTNGTGDTELKGVVKTVSPRAERGLTSVQYKVIVSVLTSCDDLRLDMTAKLNIVLEEKKGVLSVPYEAIQVDEKGYFYGEVLDSGNPVDFSGVSDGTMTAKQLKELQKTDTKYESHKVIVTKGLESDYYVEIFSDELTAGTTVVIPSNDVFSNIGIYVDEEGATGGF